MRSKVSARIAAVVALLCLVTGLTLLAGAGPAAAQDYSTGGTTTDGTTTDGTTDNTTDGTTDSTTDGTPTGGTTSGGSTTGGSTTGGTTTGGSTTGGTTTGGTTTGGSGLPTTGSSVATPVGVGLVLLAAGAAILGVRRVS
jgi:LPXTG-motif cell wall-anchored protein